MNTQIDLLSNNALDAVSGGRIAQHIEDATPAPGTPPRYGAGGNSTLDQGVLGMMGTIALGFIVACC